MELERASRRRSLDKCTKNGVGCKKAQRFEGKKLSLSGNCSSHLGNNSLKRNFQEYLGFHEEEISRTMKISNKMRVHGEKMEEVTIVKKILNSLTPKFDCVVCSIEESKDTNSLSLDELQSSLLVHEQKMNRSSTSKEQALKDSTFTHSSNFRGRGRGSGRGD
ncbi:hypothetical protein ACH5RR_022740 [Cinchona calisaya]|uniref:Uncharacterized protein n=1 Tax=Cinchona calisaya TaxID=153742 RepID=A0ABD2ZDM4_9GENT